MSRNNLTKSDCEIPLGVLTTVTGVSGSGRSSLIAQALVDLVSEALGEQSEEDDTEGDLLEQEDIVRTEGHICASVSRPPSCRAVRRSV